ncbi:hypothetical protein [Lysobacter xanthus]
MNIARTSVLLLAVAAGAAVAAEPAKPATHSVTAAGIKVGIDPTTGQLRPLTGTESAELEVEGPAVAGPTTEEILATRFNAAAGGTGFRVPADLQSVVRATTGPDGRVVIDHGQAQAPTREVSDR